MAVTLKDVIKEAMEFLGGEGTIQQVRDFIESNYGPRWKDVGVAMADLTFPGSRSSQYPLKERFLEDRTRKISLESKRS